MDRKRWTGIAARTGLVLFGLATLTACNGAGAGDGSGGGSGGFTATITIGSVTESISGSGYFMCETVNGGEFNISKSSILSSNDVLLSLPDWAGTGDFTLESEDPINIDEAANTAEYYGGSGQVFDQNVAGSLTLTASPSSPGGRVAGTFSFTADDGVGNTVSVTDGSFDFSAGSFSFDFCPAAP